MKKKKKKAPREVVGGTLFWARLGLRGEKMLRLTEREGLSIKGGFAASYKRKKKRRYMHSGEVFILNYRNIEGWGKKKSSRGILCRIRKKVPKQMPGGRLFRAIERKEKKKRLAPTFFFRGSQSCGMTRWARKSYNESKKKKKSCCIQKDQSSYSATPQKKTARPG